MIKTLFLVLSFSLSLYAKECRIDDNIILSILKAESSSKGAGYEYIIAFNNENEALFVKSRLKSYFVDSRTLDCKNLETCVKITETLIKIGIKNIDLGAFQINYRSHKLPKLEDYFIFSKGYYFACNFLEQNIGKFGFNWYAIAGYHSFTQEHNLRYQRMLKQNLEVISRWKKYNGS